MTVRASDSGTASARRVLLAALVTFVLALAVKLPQLGLWHGESDEGRPTVTFEPDEIVYWQLAQRLWQDGEYSLRGTSIAAALPPAMYDHPLFHHPPLFPALLGPWAANSAAPYPPDATLWITWLAHALFAAAVVATGLRLAANAGAAASRGTALLAACAVATDPFGWFASRFLWIDAVAMACAAGAAWCALGRRGPRWFAAAGALCGLAALSKLTGGVVLVALALERLLRRDAAAGRGRELVALVLPAGLAIGTWLLVFRWHTGAVLPTWIAPGAEVLARDAHMARGFERTPFAYLWIVPLVQPLALWVVAATWRARRSVEVRVRTLGLALWFVGGGAAIAATSWLGTTPVLTRQLAPVVPALYVAAVFLLARRPERAWRVAFAACVLLAALAAWRDVHATGVYELRGLLGWS